MKRVKNTIKLAISAVLSMGFATAAIAEHHESTKLKAPLQTEEESKVEIYDYHSGVTYTGTLQRFMFHRHLENVAEEPENRHSESTQMK
ncbi:hypothetical protein [Methylomonas fluvii]|uniref:Uncharacterized protein n=1 Tax=Methylomonas fluvii TaxID=1854564 RepID=A0ABR9DA45_9GAMM|nr:hypothetical protein [Methylomonas fluvii]MBD9359168.1 hypothetical protein [Methylomonas fluvii]